MYTTDPLKPPKRPVVSSLAGALAEVKAWQTESQLDQVRDGDGLTWVPEVKATQVADPADPRKVLWQVRIALTAQVTAGELTVTGGLDPVKDARLLELVGTGVVNLAMKPLVYRVASEEAAKTLLVEVLPRLKASLLRSSLAEVKRMLVGRWVDEQGIFGGSKSY